MCPLAIRSFAKERLTDTNPAEAKAKEDVEGGEI